MSDHSYSETCGCPGCQFMYFAMKALEHGPPPIIGTFEPVNGDVARDCDDPLSPLRTWIGDRWWPYFEVKPRMEKP